MTRRSHRKKRIANAIRQLPWQNVVNPYTPVEILDADQVETIIDAALTVIETQGMRFLEPGSRDLMKNAGADVDDDSLMVRMESEIRRCGGTGLLVATTRSRERQSPAVPGNNEAT